MYIIECDFRLREEELDFQNLKINGTSVTEKESLVISCLMNGKRTKSIALLLGVSPNTVISHLRNIMTKLGVSSQDQIIRYAEKSEFYAYLKNLYLKAKFQSDFKEALEKIRRIIQNKNIGEKIYVSLQDAELNDLKQDLALAGVNADFIKVRENPGRKSHYFSHLNDEKAGSIYEVSGKKIDNYYSAVLFLIKGVCNIPEISSISESFHYFIENAPEENMTPELKKEKNSKKWMMYLGIGFLAFSLTWGFLTKDGQLISNINNSYHEHYIPRNSILNKIQEILKKQTGIKSIVLSGEGGIGKTTLAGMYAVQQNFKLKWKINAETEYSVKRAFISIATSLAIHGSKSLKEEMMYIKSIPDKEESFDQTLMLVFRNLKRFDDWCIIFDNVDNFQMVQKYVPTNAQTSGNGTVIITTRNSNAGSLLRCAQLSVEYLKDYEQLGLFSKVYGKKFENSVGQNVVKIVLKKLSPLPLDITISANYLKALKVDPSIFHTLAFSSVNANVTKYAPLDHPQTRYELVSKMLDKLLENDKDFEDLLLLLCVVNSQEIPKRLLVELKDEGVADGFILNLQRYSLITAERSVISIHRNLQDMIRKYVFDKLKDLDEKISRVIDVLANPEFIRINATHEEVSALLPHINEGIKVVTDSDLVEKSELITKLNVGKFFVLLDIDSPTNTNKFAEENILSLEKYDDINPKDLVLLMNDVAYGYMRAGESQKAKRVLDRCFEIYDQFSDESYEPLKAVSQAYLINVNAALGKVKYSIADFKSILARLEASKDLMSNTAKAIICYQCYSFCVDNGVLLGDLRNFTNIMEEFLKSIGSDSFYHKNKSAENKSLPFFVPGIRYRMAGIYNILEEYDKALENIKEVQFFYDKRKKDGNLSMTLQSDLDLEYAVSLSGLGRFNEAYDVLQRVIQTKSQIRDDHDIFRAFVCLMETCIRLGKYENIKKLAIDAVARVDKRKCYRTGLLYLRYLYAKFMAEQKTNDSQTEESYEKFQETLNDFARIYGLDSSLVKKRLIKN